MGLIFILRAEESFGSIKAEEFYDWMYAYISASSFWVLGGKQSRSWETSEETVTFVQTTYDGHSDQVVSNGGRKK